MNNVLNELPKTVKQRLWREEAKSWDLTFVVNESGCLCYGSGELDKTELPSFRLLKTMGRFVNSVSNMELDRHGNELWETLIVVSEELWYDVSQISDLRIRRQVLDMVSLETHAQDVKERAFQGDYTSPSEDIQKELRMKVLLG